MKMINYISIVVALLCFAGAVGASGLFVKDVIPNTEKMISYLNQAHIQDQSY